MINLEKISGLPIDVLDDYYLKFNPPLHQIEPSIRKFSDMTPVLQDKSAKVDREEMYYMYRDIHLPDDTKVIRDNNIRYDITVIPSVMIGKEFNKTVGHYHPNNSQGYAYPEIYEVLNGEAMFFIQKMDEKFEKLLSVSAIRAHAGEKIIYPPYYGHIMVNVGKDVLVTANWVSDNFDSEYKPVSERGGMAFYVVADENQGFKFEANPNYSSHPEVRMISTDFMKSFAIMGSRPMYSAGVEQPELLAFLNFPEKFAVELSAITS
ncbi:MAG: glucose-6-phosphate isomerase [Candidatus Doudnabacteria bacterium]|nr:glucose-6-phosphate isomerase [Candidatus Doudnabacteria bacterium]